MCRYTKTPLYDNEGNIVKWEVVDLKTGHVKFKGTDEECGAMLAEYPQSQVFKINKNKPKKKSHV